MAACDRRSLAQSGGDEEGEPRIVLDVLRIVHILSACVWVGGTIVLVFVGVPAIRKADGEARATRCASSDGRWRPLGWSAMGVAVLSGLWLTEQHGGFNSAALDTDFDRVLILKSALVAALVRRRRAARLRHRPAPPARAPRTARRRRPRRGDGSCSSGGSTSHSRSRYPSSARSRWECSTDL